MVYVVRAEDETSPKPVLQKSQSGDQLPHSEVRSKRDFLGWTRKMIFKTIIDVPTVAAWAVRETVGLREFAWPTLGPL